MACGLYSRNRLAPLRSLLLEGLTSKPPVHVQGGTLLAVPGRLTPRCVLSSRMLFSIFSTRSQGQAEVSLVSG